MSRRATIVMSSLLALGLLISGCGKDKEEALAEVEKIQAACKEGKKDEAKKLALALRDKNGAFKKAFDGATDKVADKAQVNICGGLVLTETKMRLKN